MKIATRAAAALLLALALVIPAAAAQADDEPAAPETTTEAPAVVEPEPVDAPQDAQEPAVTPESAQVAPEAQEPQLPPQDAPEGKPGKGHDPVTFCHKPGTPAQQELTTDDDGLLNGHLGHGDSLGACPQLEQFDGWVTWLAPNYVPVDPTLAKIGLPQTLVGLGQLTPETCELTYQQDHYVGLKADVDAILADGKLSGTVQHPEDSAVVTEWKFVSSATCPPPPPAPQPCVATGSWYTEDIAPELTPDGYLFTGSKPTAVNYLHPVTGNVQGFTGASYTLADVAGYQPALRFVVNPNAGTLHYASISVEPYLNGWSAGQSGTFTVTPSSLAWSSKIATGPGSQSSPVPLSSFGTIWPDNQLISLGFHLGSTNESDTHAVITGAQGGCISASFTTVKPEPRVTTETWTDSECTDPLDGTAQVTTYGQDTTYPQVWEDGQYVEGDGVQGDVYVIGTEAAEDETCEPEPTPTPTPTETPTPTVTPTPTDQPTVTIATITPAAPQAALAHTGADGTGWLVLAGITALVVGLLALLAKRARRA